MHKSPFTLGALGLAVVLFFAVNVLGGATLRSTRFDLTEENLYTLSQGSKNILDGLQSEVTLNFFYSKSLVNETSFKPYAERVYDMLREYEARSNGKLTLEVIDPEPFSDEELRARQSGLAGIPAGNTGDAFYLGLIGSNKLGDEEVIRFFEPPKERFLEHDLTRLIYTLENPERRRIGLISTLPIAGGQQGFQQAQPSRPFIIIQQLRQLYEVDELATDLSEIPDDVDVLMIVHPKELPDSTVYAIDQYVMGGGRAMIFVDPQSQMDQPPPNPQNPMAQATANRSSDLPRLFNAWGFEMVPAKVATDREAAVEVQNPAERQRRDPVSYVAYLNLTDTDGHMNEEDAVTRLLKSVRIFTPGALRPLPDSGAQVEFTPLLQTGLDSTLTDLSYFSMQPDPKELLNTFYPTDQRYTVAARISGTAPSAFPDGPPADPLSEEPPLENPDHLSESQGEINLIVVADSDLLIDQLWTGEVPLFGTTVKVHDNGDLVTNGLDNLTGSDDLISVRTSGRFQRPFEKVEEIIEKAEQQFLQKEEELQSELQNTRTRLSQLQQGNEGEGTVILTAELQAEIERFREKEIEVQRELRAVQRDKEKDIRAWGSMLKLIHIALLPLAFGLGSAAFGVMRMRRRTA